MLRIILLSFVVFFLLPTSGFCFPEISEKEWRLDSIWGFWENPQYVSRENISLGVHRTTSPWEKYPWSAFGYSRGYYISVSQDRYHPVKFRIVREGGYQEKYNAVEEYKHPLDKNKIIYFVYLDDGILIFEFRLRYSGFFWFVGNIFCYWQTLEMLEASSKEKCE